MALFFPAAEVTTGQMPPLGKPVPVSDSRHQR